MSNNNLINDEWVEAQLASLPVVHQEPNTAKALAELRAREGNRRVAQRWWTWAISTAVAISVAVLALPGSRALAQRLWETLFLKHPEVVRVNVENLPKALTADVLSGGSAPEDVSSIEEAERKAGFRPVLPLRLRNPPPFRELLAAPAGEASAVLRSQPRLEAGPIVVADYGELSLLQCRPSTLAMPSGFDTARFLEVAFRILGADEAEALRMKAKFAADPAWFRAIPREKQATIQEVSLRSGVGVYIEDFDNKGVREGAAVIWNTPERIYLVGGTMSRELALVSANSIP